MKYIEVHILKEDEQYVFAVNPLQLSAIAKLPSGRTRIFYNTVRMPDDVKEDYETLLMKINDALESR